MPVYLSVVQYDSKLAECLLLLRALVFFSRSMNEDIGVQVNTLNAIFSQVQAVQAVGKIEFCQAPHQNTPSVDNSDRAIDYEKKQELTKKNVLKALAYIETY